jgi:type IV pilus biogenesis protein CpaD/CtpE
VDGRSSVTRLLLAGLALASATAFLLAGCSTDTIFPAVHDIPAPRPDAPLTAEEVKQATDSLITERDHLSTETQTAARPAAVAKTAAQTAANTKTGTPKKPPVVPRAAAVGTAGADGTLTAGAETKP